MVVIKNVPAGISLELAALQVSYSERTVIDSLSLKIVPGELFGLLGPSGCGKSTTLGVIAGFVEPDSGTVRLDERDVTRLPMQRRGIGVVFQSYALFPHMTVAENVGYGLRMRKKRPHDYQIRVEELLALVRLDGRGERYPRELSGGEQQRVAIARALAISPKLLLLDEPLSNLDAKLRSEMQSELRRIQKEANVTTVLVTHDQEEAFAICDRIAVMNKGRIEQVGTPREIYRSPSTQFVAQFVGKATRLDGRACESGQETAFVVSDTVLETAMTIASGKAYSLYLRPEEVRLGIRQNQGNSLAGQVTAIRETGSHAVYTVATRIGTFEVCSARGEPEAEIGDQVYVSWAATAGAMLEV